MRRSLLFPAAFTLAGVAILFSLGLWQWQRRAEKTELIQTIAQRVDAPPAPLPEPATWATIDLANASYRPVTASGRFDHAREAHVFFALPKPKGGHGGPGFLIITPFLLEGGGVALVNRGFVPQGLKEASARAAGQSEGRQTITGLMRLPERRGAFSGADDAARNVFYVRDPAAIAAAKGIGPVAPFLIDLKTPMPSGGLPVPDVTLIDIPNNHLQYALTWWSLGAILAVIFLLFASQRSR